MKAHELKAKSRKLFGRKVKSLRRDGVIPGNVFGGDMKSIAVQFDKKAVVETIKTAGVTSLVNLMIEGESKAHPVLIAGYHTDPVSGAILHVDLHEVNLKEKTTASVPVHTIGESSAVASGNVLVVLRNEIEVEALPTDLPDAIEVDIAGLTEIGMSVLGKDLKVDRSKVTLKIDDEEPVVTIQEPAKEEVVEAPVAAEGEAAPAEGAKPAEGEAAPADAKKE